MAGKERAIVSDGLPAPSRAWRARSQAGLTTRRLAPPPGTLKRSIAAALPIVFLVLGAGRWAGAASSPPSAVVAPQGPVTHAGRWLTDGRGRVVVIHGINVPSKALPAYPAALNFGEDDAVLLAASGFNAVRLTVERYAVEPQPGHFDDAYISHVAATVSLLARHGIMSLIDFHQDEFGPVFNDNGYPAWMTVTDGLPNITQVGFPFQYLVNPALNRAFDHLWANDPGPTKRPLQADDALILGHVARRLRSTIGVLGYEVINEPWPGTQYPLCLLPTVGCPSFDRGPFSAYYGRMIRSIEAADPAHLIFYEPVSTFNQGVPTSVTPPKRPRLGFAFHDYPLCSDFGSSVGATQACATPNAEEDAMVISNALAHVAATGNALLLTEFGATTDPIKLGNELAQYDANMIPWMFWSYTRYIDPYAPDGTLKPATSAYVNHAMLEILARPYPELVAGTPRSWAFDPDRKVFRFVYSTKRVDGHGSFGSGSETDIALPAIQYPNGYHVAVTGATVVSAPNAPVLRLRSRPNAAEVTVSVARPGGGFAIAACPSGAHPIGPGISLRAPDARSSRLTMCTDHTGFADGSIDARADPSHRSGYAVEGGQPTNPPPLRGYLGVDTQHGLTLVGCGGGAYDPSAPDAWTQPSTSPKNNAVASTGMGMLTAPSGPILGGPCSPRLLPWLPADTGPGPPPGSRCGHARDAHPEASLPPGAAPVAAYASLGSRGDLGLRGDFGGPQGASGYAQLSYDVSNTPRADVTTSGQSKGGGGVVSAGNDGFQTLYPLTPPGSPIVICQD